MDSEHVAVRRRELDECRIHEPRRWVNYGGGNSRSAEVGGGTPVGADHACRRNQSGRIAIDADNGGCRRRTGIICGPAEKREQRAGGGRAIWSRLPGRLDGQRYALPGEPDATGQHSTSSGQHSADHQRREQWRFA